VTADTAREQLPGWLLDEVASAGRENLDAGHVARYDDKEDASAVEEVALLQRLGLTSSSIVIDVGAGTGQFTRRRARVRARGRRRRLPGHA